MIRDRQMLSTIGPLFAQFESDASFIVPVELDSESGIYLISADGSKIDRISPLGEYITNSVSQLLLYTPVLAPDEDSDSAAKLIDIDTGECRSLRIRISGPTPVWNNGGSQFAFVGDLQGSLETSIFVFDTADDTVALRRNECGHYLKWAESGALISMLLSTDRTAASVCLFEGESEIEHQTLLTLDIGIAIWGFSLSPNDRYACYLRYTDEECVDVELVVAELASGSIVTISAVDSEFVPSWSPDSKALLYIGTNYDGCKILKRYVVDRNQITELLVLNEGDSTGEVQTPPPLFLYNGRYVCVVDFELSGDAIVVIDITTQACVRLKTNARLGKMAALPGSLNNRIYG